MRRIDGLEFLLAADVEPYIVGQVLDFVQNWRGEGFAIRPAAGGGC